jgi:hypothetical protein
MRRTVELWPLLKRLKHSECFSFSMEGGPRGTPGAETWGYPVKSFFLIKSL